MGIVHLLKLSPNIDVDMTYNDSVVCRAIYGSYIKRDNSKSFHDSVPFAMAKGFILDLSTVLRPFSIFVLNSVAHFSFKSHLES